MSIWDVAVIGAGHAGCEAAIASARLGAKTIMFAINMDTVAWMPCNPAIGGPAKGNLVREIDALGGAMGKVADRTALQMKVLNTSKGPAVQALRAQNDKKYYSRAMLQVLDAEPNLTLKQAIIEGIEPTSEGLDLIDQLGERYCVKAVILATGTFLRGKIHIGFKNYSAGRAGEFSADALTGSLLKLGFEAGRLKTGTPARVDGRTIDFSRIEPANGNSDAHFSFVGPYPDRPDVPCYLAYTNPATHQIILDNLDRSPLYCGLIEGVGPRYCPSIEDKVVRFADKDRHPLFIEPEGLDTHEMYVQGMSTSLPFDVQLAMLRSIEGLEKVEITRPGYAVEYDYLPATQLFPTLQSKIHPGIFAAGQINGTSGYEEAAAQGLIAGINAARYTQGKEQVVLSRAESYIGTLIDDLVSKEIRDPYRMLTSRSEYRLVLRHGNADRRLTPLGREIGLVDDARWESFTAKESAIQSELAWIKTRADAENLKNIAGISADRGLSLEEVLRRPEIPYSTILAIGGRTDPLDPMIQEEVETEIKYAGYIERQNNQIERLRRLEEKAIPEELDYRQIRGLSREAQDKLMRIRPRSIGQASRVGGVTPADVSLLLVHLEGIRRQGDCPPGQAVL